MSIADEIERLTQLRNQGALSEAEFEAAKARVLGGTPGASGGNAWATGAAPAASAASAASVGGLRRSRRDAWIGGVCGGLGYFTGLESWLWRLLFVFSFLCLGFGVLPYLLLWIFVPRDDGI